MSKYTYEQIATNYNLWSEYVDPEGIENIEWFYDTPTEEKIAIMVSCFGPENAPHCSDESIKVILMANITERIMADMIINEARKMVDNDTPIPEELENIFHIEIRHRLSGTKYAVVNWK